MRALSIAILLAGACGGGSLAGDATDGAEVFAAACASCHGPSGAPTEAMVAALGVRNLTTPEFHARATVELVEHQVRTGSANKRMPPVGARLTDPQIEAVARYVLTLSKPAR
jgi:mono/diheme cytochrome c family protein